MGDDGKLSIRERVRTMEHVEAVVRDLSQMAGWLTDLGEDAAALQAEDAAKSLMACGWLLGAPVHAAGVPGIRAASVAELLADRHRP